MTNREVRQVSILNQLQRVITNVNLKVIDFIENQTSGTEMNDDQMVVASQSKFKFFV